MNDCVTLRNSSDTYGRIARRFGKFVQFVFDSACTERHRLRNLSYIARAMTRSPTMPSSTATTSATSDTDRPRSAASPRRWTSPS